MKRQTITEIITKVHLLTIRSARYEYVSYAAGNCPRIIKAGANEINRLIDKIKDHCASVAFDAGFTCAEIAATSIIKAQNQYDQDITPAPSSDLANIHAGVPGPSYNPIVSELQQIICGSLKPKQ